MGVALSEGGHADPGTGVTGESFVFGGPTAVLFVRGIRARTEGRFKGP